jgi:hypothetical protein
MSDHSDDGSDISHNDTDTPRDVVMSDHSDDGSDISHDDTDVSDNGDVDISAKDADGKDDDPWEGWVDSTLEQFQQRTKKRVAELRSEHGMRLKDARKTTSEELLPQMNKELRKKFLAFLKLGHRLKQDSTYQKIMDTAKRTRFDDEMDWEESVTYAVKSRKLLLDRVLQRWISDWDYGIDDSDDEDESEDGDDETDDEDDEGDDEE